VLHFDDQFGRTLEKCWPLAEAGVWLKDVVMYSSMWFQDVPLFDQLNGNMVLSHSDFAFRPGT